MGVIPTKKSLGESIEWIHCDREAAKSLMKQENILAIENMLIDLGDDHGVNKGLGCSICKGPPDRPGIYVQSIKTGGAAYRYVKILIQNLTTLNGKCLRQLILYF